MSGVDKGFNLNALYLEKIVDYIIALESVFLIDNIRYFLKRTISERIANLLEAKVNFKKDRIKEIIKFMYDERSRIIHGNYVDIEKKKKAQKIRKLKDYMEDFEIIIREVIRNILEFNFLCKSEIVSFMRKNYNVPYEANNIMENAKLEAEKLL